MPQASFRTGLCAEDATRDPAMRSQRHADPLMHGRVTASWFCEMTDACQQAAAQASAVSRPLLILQAGDYRMVDSEAARQFFHRVASRDKTFRLYESHYHELLREIDREAIVEEMLDWLEGRTADEGAPAAAPVAGAAPSC